MKRSIIVSLFLFALVQWGEWCWEDGEHQAAAEVSLSDEPKLCRYSSVREDHTCGAGPRPEQVLFKPQPLARVPRC